MRLLRRSPDRAAESGLRGLLDLPRRISFTSVSRFLTRLLVVVARVFSLVFAAWLIYALATDSYFGGLDVLASAAAALILREWWASRTRRGRASPDHGHPSRRSSRSHS